MTAQAGFTPHVSTLGSGPRRVLALHCTLAFGGAWGGMVKLLGEDLTFVAPDMPSHGRSVDWDEDSSFADTVLAASLSVMDDAPMDVIGHSFGAATALRMAVEHPARVRSITLIEPVFFAVAMADAPETMSDHDGRAQPFVDAMQAGDRALAARLFNRMWSEAGTWDRLPDRTRAAMTRAIHVVPDTHAFLYDDLCGMLEPGQLHALTVPTLLIRGEQALPAIAAVNDGLCKRIPGAAQSVIAGAGHMAPISHPAETAEAFASLLERA